MKTFEEILEERKKKKQNSTKTSVSNSSTRKSFDDILAERGIVREKNLTSAGIMSTPTATVPKTNTFEDALTKKYSTMSLADIEKEYARIEAEEKAFKDANGGKLINYLTKAGSYLAEGMSGQSMASTRTKSQTNIDKIDSLTREKEIINIYRKQKATEEYLGGLNEEQLLLLDNISTADKNEKAEPLTNMLGSLYGVNPATTYYQSEPERQIGKSSREKLFGQLKEKNPNKSEEELNELIDKMVELRSNQVNAEEQKKQEEDIQKTASESEIASFLISRGANIYGGITGLTELYLQRDNEYGLDTNAFGFSLTNASNTIDEQIQLDHDWTIKVGDEEIDGFDFFYNAGTGIVDNIGRLAVSGGNSNVAGAMMFAQGATQKIIEGKEKGYSDAKALTKGLLNGTFEALTEKYSLDLILDGGGSALKQIAKSFVVEGSEEVSSNWLNRIADTISEGKNSELTKLYDYYINEGYTEAEALTEVVCSVIGEDFESFLIGGISGGVMGGGVAVLNSAQQKNDNKLTNDEKAVVNKVVEDRVAEKEAKGEKVSKRDKNKIYDEVVNELNKGYIGISDIESALGGETYKQYQSAVEKDNQMKELQKEYDTLYKMKNGEKSDEQIDRQKELKQQLEEYRSTSKLTELKDQLSSEVSELAKVGKLNESYNEKTRRSQAFEADLTQYDAKAQETVKRAIDSGILNNTNRTHEFVDMIAKLSADKGVPFDFTNNTKLKESGFAIEGKQVNGYVQGNNVAINIDSTSALNKVVGHEITHILEGTELYTELVNAVKELATTKGEYDSKLQSITKLYEGVEDANIENELTADLIGEYLFTDSDFINRLSAEKPTLFQKIFDEIKYLCKVATAGSKEAKQLEKVKKTFEEAYRQKNNTATDDGVRYSLNNYSEHQIENWKNSKNIIIYENSNQLLNFVKDAKQGNNLSKKMYFGSIPKDLANEIHRNTGIDVSDYNCTLRASEVKKIFKSHGNEETENKRGQRAITESDFVLIPKVIQSPDSISLSEKLFEGKPVIEFTKVIDDKVVVSAYVSKKHLDLTVQTMFAGKKKGNLATAAGEQAPADTPEANVGTVSTNIISNSAENVKENSKSDSIGRELSPEVVEYFKDSKARDKDGNLLVLYHQTDGYFNVFDTHRQGAGSADNETPYGIFLKSNSKDIGLKGKNQIPLYANITNPLVAENRQELVYKISQLSVEYLKLHNRRQEIDAEYSAKNDKARNELRDFIIKWREQNKDADSRSLYDSNEFNELFDAEDSILEEWTAEVERVSAEGKKVLTEVLKENGYDGIILHNDVGSFGRSTDAYIALESNQVKNIDNVNPTTNEDIRYSLTDNTEDIGPVRERNNIYGEDIKLQSASAEDIAPTAEDVKNQDTLVIDDAPIKDASSEDVTEENNVEDTIDAEAVTRLSSKVISTLGIGKSKANRNAVRELVKALGDNYSISSKEDLYNAVAEKFGTQYVEELNEEIAGARSYLKEVKINVPNSVKSEFGSNKDYRSFVKSNFGKLWLSKEGSGIDQIYAELNEMYPHLFPKDKVNQADQLKQISDVVNKPKSDFIPFELDEDILQEATDLIYDSVTEYREAVNKVNQVNADIEAADISEKVKGQIKEELLTAYEKIEAEFNIDKKNLINKLNERKSFLETDTADKNTFLQYHAGELYGELKNLKKGIKASEDLAYFLDLGFNWNELKSTLLKVSKWPDTVLNAESDIEKTVRDFLDQKYDDSIQELNDFDWTMEDEISSLESKADEKRENARLAVNGKLVREIMDAEQVAMMGDTSLWKDKSKGFMYKTETEHRNFRDIVRDKNGKRNYKVADALYDYFMGTYNHNEAELKREANKIKKEYADLKLNKYEDVFVQMKGEFLHNPDSELTQHDIDTFIKLYGDKIDEIKVDKTIDMARETYDSLIERMNEVLVAHGMKPIEYRKGYFPHFSEVEKGKLAQLAEKFLNWKTQNNDIPTDIAGMTESFKPNRSWQSFNKQRINDETDYSFMKGFDSYLQGSLDWIYHIDDIMKRRVFENRIRYDHSDEGIKQQIQEIYKNNEFDTNAKQKQIDLVFREAENPLNNFIIDFRTRTNTLAGKKSSMDRGMEEFTNRKFYSTMTNISNRVTANMVVGSVSSALTNFIPITQSWGEVSPKSSLRAMKDTIKSTFKDDGTIDKSDFLTNRFKDVENLYQTTWDKVIDKAGFMMEAIDNFTSQTVWRSKYLENMSKGMSEAEAIKNADEFAEGLIAGRSRGNMPTIFDSKNPLIKMATAFQLEVNNQYRYMFKDMPQNMKNESVAKLAKGYATMFIGAYAYNAAYSALTGRDAAFDPLGIFEELLRDLGWLGDDEEEEPADIIMNLTDNLLEEVPFVGGLLGGGRVPISSALPYDDGIYGAFEGVVTDVTEGDWKHLAKEMGESFISYLLLPAGGGQIKKTVQGLSMFDDDLPIAGSYTDSGKLRFSVDETMDEMIKAGLFGQYASNTARQYFDEERAPLSDKQTKELVDLDIPIADYWKYRDGLKALGEDAELAEKVAYIADLEEFDIRQKNIMANNLTTRKDPIDLTDYDKYGDLEELDYAVKNPGKYAVSKAVGGYSEYIKYSEHLNNITSEKNAKGETVSGSRKTKVARYINNLDIDYGEKIILYRSQYKSDDTYNTQIIDYLNSRDDISRKEMETILKELGFEVYADGTVRW